MTAEREQVLSHRSWPITSHFSLFTNPGVMQPKIHPGRKKKSNQVSKEVFKLNHGSNAVIFYLHRQLHKHGVSVENTSSCVSQTDTLHAFLQHTWPGQLVHGRGPRETCPTCAHQQCMHTGFIRTQSSKELFAVTDFTAAQQQLRQCHTPQLPFARQAERTPQFESHITCPSRQNSQNQLSASPFSAVTCTECNNYFCPSTRGTARCS